MPRGVWKRPSDLERLLARCARDETTGCLNCSGRTWMGYLTATVNGKHERAHRAAWLLLKGPIPLGKHVLHKCDNRSCIEETHLFLGTNRENVDDKIAKGRQPRGEAVAGARLTAEQALAIYADCRPQEHIAADFDVARATVASIKQGRNWRHVTQANRSDR